jgi:hypothetical protein
VLSQIKHPDNSNLRPIRYFYNSQEIISPIALQGIGKLSIQIHNRSPNLLNSIHSIRSGQITINIEIN